MVTYRCCWILAFLQAQKRKQSPLLKLRVSAMTLLPKPPPLQKMYILTYILALQTAVEPSAVKSEITLSCSSTEQSRSHLDQKWEEPRDGAEREAPKSEIRAVGRDRGLPRKVFHHGGWSGGQHSEDRWSFYVIFWSIKVEASKFLFY